MKQGHVMLMVKTPNELPPRCAALIEDLVKAPWAGPIEGLLREAFETIADIAIDATLRHIENELYEALNADEAQALFMAAFKAQRGAHFGVMCGRAKDFMQFAMEAGAWTEPPGGEPS